MVEIFEVTAKEVLSLAQEMRLDVDDIEPTVIAARSSDPALGLFYNNIPFALCGFIPTALLSGSAYAWMNWTSQIYDIPKASTRAAVEVFAKASERYERIYGHCSYGDRPVRLLRHLGAKFWIDVDGRPAYIIEARR